MQTSDRGGVVSRYARRATWRSIAGDQRAGGDDRFPAGEIPDQDIAGMGNGRIGVYRSVRVLNYSQVVSISEDAGSCRIELHTYGITDRSCVRYCHGNRCAGREFGRHLRIDLVRSHIEKWHRLSTDQHLS